MVTKLRQFPRVLFVAIEQDSDGSVFYVAMDRVPDAVDGTRVAVYKIVREHTLKVTLELK